MKRFMILLCAVAVVGLAAAAAQAAITITFDPDALIQAYPPAAGTSDVAGQNKVSQENARRVHQPWGTVYETFYNPANPQPQNNSYNTYMNWRDSLGVGEGIAVFNSWFIDGPAARTWGEKVVVKPGTTITGTATDGWQVRVIANPYGIGGGIVQWWTLDSSKYINTVSNIGDFSITADLYWDTGPAGWDLNDLPVLDGDVVRFWLGCLNGDDPETYRSDTQALYFDNVGWGNRPSNVAPFNAIYSDAAGHYGSGFESVLTTPEPATIIVWSLLGMVAVGFGVWRRKRAA
jgi:hypothetical protein